MAKKNTLKTLSTSIKWLAIGIDLAKYSNTVVGISDDGEFYCVEYMQTEDLIVFASKIEPTVFAMEPCNGANILSLNLQSHGHEVKTISGKSVKTWVENHCANQKNDRNDAMALACLTRDAMLKPIRTKTLDEMRMMSVYAAREQMVKTQRSILTSIKGLAQAWGILFQRDRRNLEKMKEAFRAQESLLLPGVVKSMEQMIDIVKHLDEQIAQLEAVMESQIENDSRAQRIRSILGVGLCGTHRVLSTCGDVNRFKGPKSFAAYYGLVPKGLSTGHNNRMGRCCKRGDKAMRRCLYQSATCLMMQNAKGLLPECPLKNWIDKKRAEKMPWQKLAVALAAKLARILWALLKYDQYFNLSRAGLSRNLFAKEANA